MVKMGEILIGRRDMNNQILLATDFRNSAFMYLLAGIIVAFVVLMSVIFMIHAYKRGEALGMEKEKMVGVIKSSALFSFAPSIAILITVLTLAGSLGFPLPWMRLSVIGSITYEVPAAQAVSDSMGMTLSSVGASELGYSTIAYVMTFGIIFGVLFIPFLVPKISGGMVKLKMKDEKWSKIFSDALFLGLIATFLGVGIYGRTTNRVTNETIDPTTGSMLVSVFTLLTSMVLMIVIGIIIKKLKIKWLENYALPICMITAMGMAILYNAILPSGLFV